MVHRFLTGIVGFFAVLAFLSATFAGCASGEKTEAPAAASSQSVELAASATEQLLENYKDVKDPQGVSTAGNFTEAYEHLKKRAEKNASLKAAVKFWEPYRPHAPTVIKSLKHTENFTKSAINHIFIGDVKNGAASGCHYAKIDNPDREILPDTKEFIGKQGVYRAKVKLQGNMKKGNKGYSTFFPDDMTPQEVVDAINEAFDSKVFVPGSKNSYVGNSSKGLEIEMYIGKEGKIISAFPRG